MRYIELNPVRAGIVTDPADYPWSSFRKNAGHEGLGWLVPRDEYFALGPDAIARASAYRDLFSRPLETTELDAIRNSIRLRSPLGSSGFLERVERSLGRPAMALARGRPSKPRKCI